MRFKFLPLVLLLFPLLFLTCQGPERDLYPETLSGYLELLPAEKSNALIIFKIIKNY